MKISSNAMSAILLWVKKMIVDIMAV